jgi:hypothetical protein
LSAVLRRRTLVRVLVAGLAMAAAGCGTPPPGPAAIGQNYVNAIAAGNYAGACAILSPGAQRGLRAAMKSSAGCPALLARCLPTQETNLKRDQVQLFYSSVEQRVAGSHATVSTSGTSVADRVKQLSLVRRRGIWELTSYGEERCRAGQPSRPQAGRRRRAHT